MPLIKWVSCMTVIVKYDDKGNPQYRSVKGIGTSESERQKARQLDNLLKTEMEKLHRRLRKKMVLRKASNGNVEFYWELGGVLRKIFFESGLIDPLEKHLYWINAALYVPENLKAKDRGPNRLHLEYCFRLAGYPKEKATKMKWGEWVYLFDSPGINREQRFDGWFESKMKKEAAKLTRNHIRLFAQSINKLLGNTETHDLSDLQLSRCYESGWAISKNLLSVAERMHNQELKEFLRNGIKKHRAKLGEVIENNMEPEVFASLVVEEFPLE